jgi:uncharacterized protein YidB (DUF937 family)
MRTDDMTRTTDETLLVKDINVDKAYQRCRSKSVEKSMVKRGFSDTLCDRIVVGRRDDGTLWVVDGQTRRNAAEQSGRETIAARVFRSNGRKHEAELFVEFNSNRRSVKAADHFRAAVEMGEPMAVEMQEALDKYGFQIGYGNKWPCITGYAKLRDAQRDGLLYSVLTVIVKTWNGRHDALKETVIGGIAEFMRKFPDANLDRCVAKWKSHDPSYFIQGSDVAQASGGNRYRGLALTLMVSYNKGLRSNRLEW